MSERSRLQDITISRYFSVPVFSSTTTRNAYEAVLYGICRIRFFSSSLVSCMCMQSFRGHECAPLPKRKRVLQQRRQKTSTSLSCAQLQKVLLQGKCSLNRAYSVCAPKIWNTVPLEIRQSSTVVLFKKKLKTFFFTRFIESNSLSYF